MSGLLVPAAARPRVLAAAEGLLGRSGAAGMLPTPLDTVAAEAGIEQILDISDLPPPLLARKPSFLRRIVGAVLYREQVAFVDYSQGEARARFTEAHEIAHRALPWHRASHELHLDDGPALSQQTQLEIEAEANLMAAHLLFQGERFHRQAVDYELTLATPLLLAPQFGTSLHASIRYYVEHHPEPAALAVAGQHRGPRGSVPVWGAAASPSFTATHGPFAHWFPGMRLSVDYHDDARPLGQVAARALRGENLPDIDLQREDSGGNVRDYRAEAFHNQRCLFLLVTPRSRLRLGRRVRLAS